MKIVIADYAQSMMPTHDYEEDILKAGLGNVDVVIHEYTDDKRSEFFDVIHDADGLLTGFVQLDEEALTHAPKLKIISINATGYDNVDVAAANRRGIGVCPVGEYCTQDVAEFTITTLLMLNKNIKHYIHDVDRKHLWQYDRVRPNKRIEEMTLGIIGFGKIGKCVAKKVQSLGMHVIATDIAVKEEAFQALGVTQVSKEELFAQADVIVNHMNLNETNENYFSYVEFSQMKQRPFFLNMGRGACVVENDLVKALDEGLLRGAGMDVLASEQPDLATHPLAHRDNVLITPHAAFYTTTSLKELQRLSCENIVHYLNGEKEKVFKLVSQ